MKINWHSGFGDLNSPNIKKERKRLQKCETIIIISVAYLKKNKEKMSKIELLFGLPTEN